MHELAVRQRTRYLPLLEVMIVQYEEMHLNSNHYLQKECFA